MQVDATMGDSVAPRRGSLKKRKVVVDVVGMMSANAVVISKLGVMGLLL